MFEGDVLAEAGRDVGRGEGCTLGGVHPGRRDEIGTAAAAGGADSKTVKATRDTHRSPASSGNPHRRVCRLRGLRRNSHRPRSSGPAPSGPKRGALPPSKVRVGGGQTSGRLADGARKDSSRDVPRRTCRDLGRSYATTPLSESHRSKVPVRGESLYSLLSLLAEDAQRRR